MWPVVDKASLYEINRQRYISVSKLSSIFIRLSITRTQKKRNTPTCTCKYCNCNKMNLSRSLCVEKWKHGHRSCRRGSSIRSQEATKRTKAKPLGENENCLTRFHMVLGGWAHVLKLEIWRKPLELSRFHTDQGQPKQYNHQKSGSGWPVAHSDKQCQ